jgi:uncharacterized membrane protein
MKDLKRDRAGFVGALLLIIIVLAVVIIMAMNLTILGFNLDTWLGDMIGKVFGGFWKTLGL